MLIYLAGPLFNQAERSFNSRVTEKLEEREFTVYLPQRDGFERNKPPYNQMTVKENREAIFALDMEKILEADIFLFVLDGRVPDEGACVELGIAYGQKTLLQLDKLLIGLHTDSRSSFLEAKLNAMVEGALDFICETENQLIAAIEFYKQENEK